MCKTRSTGAGGSHLAHLGGGGAVGVWRSSHDLGVPYLIKLCYDSVVGCNNALT